jgi:hypothetical protein
MYPVLNLPVATLKVRQSGDVLQVYDIVRKKYIHLTPEEWVRQHVIHYCIQLKYPMALMAVESGLKMNRVQNRTDVLIYNREGKPWMLIECKAPEIKINQSTLQQALRYHLKLNIKYLLLTNGLQHFCYEVSSGTLQLQQSMPLFS